MSRSLGCVLFKNREILYFIYSHTGGVACPTLYLSSQEAWEHWDDETWPDTEIAPDDEPVIVLPERSNLEEAKLALDELEKGSRFLDLPEYAFTSIASRKKMVITGPLCEEDNFFDWMKLEDELLKIAQSWTGKKVQLQVSDCQIKLLSAESQSILNFKVFDDYAQMGWDLVSAYRNFPLTKLSERTTKLLTDVGVLVEVIERKNLEPPKDKELKIINKLTDEQFFDVVEDCPNESDIFVTPLFNFAQAKSLILGAAQRTSVSWLGRTLMLERLQSGQAIITMDYPNYQESIFLDDIDRIVTPQSCKGCQYLTDGLERAYMICALHPSGLENCPDYKKDEEK